MNGDFSLKGTEKMKKDELAFVKGHMGGNEIILLQGAQVPQGKEVDWALAILNPPHIRGHQVGLLYEGPEPNQIKAKIVSVSKKDFVSSCGGLTQVLGKAIFEENLGEHLGLQIHFPLAELVLETGAGPVVIAANGVDGTVKTITTKMTPFVNECYELGTWPMEVAGVGVTKVGKVLVAAAEEIRRRFPSVDLERIDASTLEVLWQIHQEFLRKAYPDWKSGDFAIYDLSTTKNADGRVIFPHHIPEGHIEPACGTGTVAIGIAIAERGNVLPRNGTAELAFASGGSRSEIGGPDLTKLWLTIKDGKVTDASFSHSPIEILATGKIWL